MARPACPACSDNFTVERVSALYQAVTEDPDRASIGNVDPDEVIESFAPPAEPRPIGRYLLIAGVAGLAISLLSGFTFMWLFIALSIGIVTEMMLYWEHLQARDDLQRAMARWRAAYCCSTHAVVFFAREPGTYSPAQFARMVHSPAARTDTGSSAPSEPSPAGGALSTR